MLSRADNELLVRTGPGTPMGELYRRFWAPVMLAAELGEPDSPPVRVHVLGEKLVAFRDSTGQIGLLSAFCPHRRANLFWGRNEQSGLRCVYHGWKFDTAGTCVDVPNCPEGETVRSKVRLRAYPTLERGGIVWAYMGPSDKQPAFPDIEVFAVPDSHRHITKVIGNANFMQFQEGDVDSSHVSLLHSRIDDVVPAFADRVGDALFADRMPVWATTETDYGLMLAARRTVDEGTYHWRVNQWLMPFCTLIANIPGTPTLAQVRVPIDDEHSILFRVYAHPDRPLNDHERGLISGGVLFPEMIPGTFTTKENIGNDYLIDRRRQQQETYTGITSITAQDLAVVEDQDGPILDRSAEYLTSSDRAIITLRKILLARAKALANGVEPPEAGRPKAYHVRPADFTLPQDVPMNEGGRDMLLAGTA